MASEITVYDRVADPMAYAERMGLAMSRSGMFGAKFNPEAGIVVAMTCLCERITPMQFIRTYHIIEGRPTMQADAMLAEFRNRGGTHKQIKSTPELASIELTDPSGNSSTFTVTWEDAKQEKWTQRIDKQSGEVHVKDNWQGPISRQDMLWHTVCKRAVRRMAPEIVSGIYTPEEAEEYPLPAPAEQPNRAAAVEPLNNSDVFDPDTDTYQVAGSSESHDVIQQSPPFDAVPSDRCNDLQHGRIHQLFQQLDYPVEAIDKALEKRGVVKIGQLTRKQADDIIEKLDGQVAEKN